MPRSMRPHHGFSIVELAAAIGVTVGLLAMLIPALSSARAIAHKEKCASNLETIGQALHSYLETHNGEFPHVAAMPGWHWGGLRYSSGTGEPFLDSSRPLNRVLSPFSVLGEVTHTFCCPADHGIGGEPGAPAHVGTGHRTACRAFGTSYRANAILFDARLAGLTRQSRGIRRSEIGVAPSRLLVLGDPIWYEVYESTGRRADWHALAARSTGSGSRNAVSWGGGGLGRWEGAGIGNVLFLDGSVRFQALQPKEQVGPIAIDPLLPGSR